MSGTFMLNGTNYTATGNLILGGGASIIQKTMAEYTALPSSEKMNGSIYKITDKALIYCLDEEYHAVLEITSADYAQLTSDEKNNGTLYVITDEETTADDIPYSAGVSVADMLDSLSDSINTVTSGSLEHAADYSLAIDDDWDSTIQQIGKLLFITLSIRVKATTYSNDYYKAFKIPSSFKMPSKQYDIRTLALTSSSTVKSVPIRFGTDGIISISRTYVDQNVIANVFVLIGS